MKFRRCIWLVWNTLLVLIIIFLKFIQKWGCSSKKDLLEELSTCFNLDTASLKKYYLNQQYSNYKWLIQTLQKTSFLTADEPF